MSSLALAAILLAISAGQLLAQIDFEARKDFSTGKRGPVGLFSGDFGGDGHRDLVCFQCDQLTFLAGRGDGSFEDAVALPAHVCGLVGRLDDVDGDGQSDIVGTAGPARQDLAVYRGTGNTPPFEPPRLFSGPVGQGTPTLGDSDDDGDLDVAAPLSSNRLALFSNDGSGGFSFVGDFPLGDRVFVVAVSDFDLDGHQDIAVPPTSFPRVDIYFGVGDFTFSGPTSFPLQHRCFLPLAVDLNSDGWMDLALTADGFNEVLLLVNDGQGGFNPAIAIPSGISGSANIVSTDLNMDGIPDLVIAGRSSEVGLLASAQSIVLSTGILNYAPPFVARAVSNAGGLAFGDFNEDGRTDIAVSGSEGSSISIELGDGAGGFGGFAQSIPIRGFNGQVLSAAADWTGDGLPDVFVANNDCTCSEVWLFAGRPDGLLEQRSMLTDRQGAYDYDIGDYDADGALDVAIVEKRATVFHGDGTGRFFLGPTIVPPSPAVTMASGDLDEDGFLDVALTLPIIDQVRIYRGDGRSFTESRILTGLPVASFANILDVDGDDHLDLSVLAGSPQILFGDGTGQFGGPVNVPHDVSVPSSVALSDFDGDSHLDVAVAGRAGDGFFGVLSIARNVGGRLFTLVESYDLPAGTVAVRTLDADGDGVRDVACTNFLDNDITVLRGRGDSTFENPYFSFGTGENPASFSVADFDGDERPDLLAITDGSRDLSLLYNRSPGFPDRTGRCLQGGVNARRGTLNDVLFLNGSPGGPPGRTLTLSPGASIRVRMEQPSSRSEKPKSNFALFAWIGSPNDSSLVTLPLETGCLASAIPATGGVPQPKKTWNNLGYFPLLGEPDFPSSPAPADVFFRASGIARPVTFTLQGLIRDDGAAGLKGISPTNGIVVSVMP